MMSGVDVIVDERVDLPEPRQLGGQLDYPSAAFHTPCIHSMC